MPEPPTVAEPDWRARLRGSRMGNVVVLGVTALAVVIGAWLVMRPGDQTGSAGESSAVSKVGQPAPGFTATALDGSQISLDELHGRPVWLVFMATWCTACRAEIPDVEAFHEQSGDDVAVIAVYVGESGSAVQPYAERLGLSFTQLPDEQTALARAYGVLGVPAHYFVDPDGVVRETRVGVLSPDQIDQAVAKATA